LLQNCDDLLKIHVIFINGEEITEHIRKRETRECKKKEVVYESGHQKVDQLSADSGTCCINNDCNGKY
jgi:hypothetical protein